MKPVYFALLLGLSLLGACTVATEEPAFTVDFAEGQFEVRAYPALVVAEVTVSGNRKEAAGKGFRLLAGFIFGGNTGKQSIKMTAPVTQQAATGQKIAMTAPVLQAGGDGKWVVRFIMPRGSVLEEMPKPNDPKVKLQSIAAARFAVVRFSGVARQAAIDSHTAALKEFIARRHLQAIGPPTLAQYDPPWTLWFLRRNEVMIAVDA